MRSLSRILVLALALGLALPATPALARKDKKEKKSGSYSRYKEAYEAGNRALEERDWDSAVDAYGKAVELAGSDSSKSKSSNAKGWVLLKARRLAEAQEAFLQAADYDPKNQLALGNLAYVSLTLYESGLAGDEALSKAKNAMDKCREMESGCKSPTFDQVEAAVNRIEAYAKATPVAETPERGMGYKAAANLGDEAQERGQFDLAMKCFEIAEKDARSKVAKGSAANRLGKALLDARRPRESIVHFERALGYDPEEKVFLNNMGFAHWVLYDSGQGGVEELKEAVKYFEKTNAVDPSYKADNLEMALKELREVDPEAAKAYETEKETAGEE